MNEENVITIMYAVADKIPENRIYSFKEKIKNEPDTKTEAYLSTHLKSPIVALLLSIFWGIFGIDRFYVGDIGVGLGKLFFGWLTFGIWPLIDIFLIYGRTKEKNFLMLTSQIY